MRKFLFVILLILGGCGFTPYGDFVREQVSERGAQAMNEGLVNSEWFLCRAASVGSIKRRYGSSDEKAKAYADLCRDNGEVPGLNPVTDTE